MENETIDTTSQQPPSEGVILEDQAIVQPGKAPVLLYVIAFLIAVIIIGGGVFLFYLNTQNDDDSGAVLCTTDTKMCSDGSYVSRSGPSCEFVECPKDPKEQQHTSAWQQYVDAAAGFAVSYPEGWRVVTDKRNPGFYGFGPEFIQEDVLWTINSYSKTETTYEELVGSMGTQFLDVVREQEDMSINELNAIQVITTTPSIDGWYSVMVIFEGPEQYYVLSNGAGTDEALNMLYSDRGIDTTSYSFEDFYSSFELIQNSSGLEVYRNEEFGFEFKYPDTLSIETRDPVVDSVNNIVHMVDVVDSSGKREFGVLVYGEGDAPSLYIYDGIQEQVTVNSTTHTAYLFPNGYECYEGMSPDECGFFAVPFEHGDYTFSIRGYATPEITQQHRDILATFTIIDK